MAPACLRSTTAPGSQPRWWSPCRHQQEVQDPQRPPALSSRGSSSFGGAPFLFATENGTVSAWAGGPNATLQATSAPGSVYKGLAIGNNGSANFLYAANFGTGKIDVFNGNFGLATVSGHFTDPNLPAGY